MLILSRKQSEQIVIDNGRIVVTVVYAHNGRVQLGIEAPREVLVMRGELLAQQQSPKPQ